MFSMIAYMCVCVCVCVYVYGEVIDEEDRRISL